MSLAVKTLPVPRSTHVLLEGPYYKVAALVDVLAHDDLGPLPITSFESTEYLAVVVVGDSPLVLAVPVEGLEHQRHLDGAPDELLESAVAAGTHDGPVKLLVGGDEPPDLLLVVGEAPRQNTLHVFCQGAEPAQVVL